MKITGLSNQWGDRLFEAFCPEPDHDIRTRLTYSRIQDLLHHLTTVDGPRLWVGTSHELLHFCSRDTESEFDRIPTLAYVEVGLSDYRIRYPIPTEFAPWEDACVLGLATTPDDAAILLLKAISHSGNNPERLGANWVWYICPSCNFHAPQHTPECERCGRSFESETPIQAIARFRTPSVPEGSAAPRQM